MNKAHMDKRLNQLPTWLWTNSTTLPPIYKMVWEAVREDKVRSNGMQTELLVDTNKVFPLLLTSQLPTEVLGHIWNLANQKYAGQLTEQELYIVLALVAAAQASYTFNSLDILHLLPFPRTPYLNIECLMNLQPVTQLNSAAKFQSLNDHGEVSFIGPDGRYSLDVKGKMKLHQHGIISSDLNTQMANNVPGKVLCFDNKSHASSTAAWDLNNVFKETKQTTRSQVDSKRSTATDPCDEFTEFQSAPIPNIPSVPIWDTKQGSAIGSRLANHNLGVKKLVEKSKKNNINVKSMHGAVQTRVIPPPFNAISQNKDQSTMEGSPEIFPKCMMKSQSKTVILKDTAIRNNDPPKEHSEKDHPNTEIMNLTNDKDVSSKPERIERVSSRTSGSTQQDLMNLQLVEDKYSALRALVQEATVSTEPDASASYNNQATDEFGEFVSAEQPATDTPAIDALNTENFAEIFQDLDFKSNNGNTNAADLNLVSEVSESLDNLKLEDTVEERSLEMGKALQKEDAISINSIDFMNGASNALTRSGSVPSLDLKSFLPSNAEDEQVMDTTHQVAIAEYWEWKQYMESCVLLLQVAANIFTTITSELMLHEVLNSAQGYNFLCNLAEVAAVCRRVNFSYKEMDINIIGFDELLMDIDRIWAEMEPFYANIPIVTELPAWPLHQGEAICCSLCLTVITSGRVVYNENNYHVTCANLWLNCVNSHLPVLRHPSLYSHSNLCPGNNHI